MIMEKKKNQKSIWRNNMNKDKSHYGGEGYIITPEIWEKHNTNPNKQNIIMS